MNKLRLYSLFLLQYLDITFAAPASTPNALGLVLSPPPANSASNSSPTSNLALPNPPPFSESIVYPIVDSTVSLLIHPRRHQPIPPDDLGTCLLSTSTRALDDIRRHGDGPLEPSDNPYMSDPLPDVNCKVSLTSWHVMSPQGSKVTLMTYGVVQTALRGLLEYMLFPDPHYYSLSFTVRDAQRGPVGAGSVSTLHG